LGSAGRKRQAGAERCGWIFDGAREEEKDFNTEGTKEESGTEEGDGQEELRI
jgi:hypothetical protein